MFGIRYLKAPPTTFVFHYVRGEVRRKGVGLNFFYFAPNSEILRIPMTSVDVPYIFNEVTADFQDAAIQGELTYRIVDPERVTKLLDFSVDGGGRYRSDDPTKLNERLVHPAQMLARSFTLQRKLRDVITSADLLTDHVHEGLKASDFVRSLGVEVMAFNVLSIKPNPEMSKAFQADAREELLRKADEAIYLRRNAAVEFERQIKENELKTEIAVEQKRREVRETKMGADIAVEQRRAELVEHQAANERKLADVRAAGIKGTVDALKGADWKTLMAAGGGGDARLHMAMAFREMAEHADRIGQLNVTPDLLASLLQPAERPAAAGPKKGKAE